MNNVKYDLPEYNGELNKKLLKYFSKNSVKLLMRFYYKYTGLDENKLKIFTDNDIIKFSFYILPKLLNIGRIKSSDYLLEDGTYISCIYGPQQKYDLDVRREFMYFNLKKYFPDFIVNKLLDIFTDHYKLNKEDLCSLFNLPKDSEWEDLFKCFKSEDKVLVANRDD